MRKLLIGLLLLIGITAEAQVWSGTQVQISQFGRLKRLTVKPATPVATFGNWYNLLDSLHFETPTQDWNLGKIVYQDSLGYYYLKTQTDSIVTKVMDTVRFVRDTIYLYIDSINLLQDTALAHDIRLGVLEADSSTYLKTDGTRPLTGDWAAGAFKISNTDSIQSPVLKATSNAVIESATPTLRLTDTDTGADSYINASSAAGSIFIQADQNNEVAGTSIGFYADGSQVGKISSAGFEVNNVTAQATDPNKFLVLDGSNIVKYRTGAEVQSDILTGGVNKYLTEWTAANALDTAFIYHDGNEYRVNTITDNGAYQWQVAGGGYFGGNVRLASASPRLDFITGGTKQWQIGTPSGTTRFSFLEDGTDERLVLEAGGNIGVATTDPLGKVDIAVTSSDGSSSSHGIRVNTGGASPFSTQIGASTSGYGWIQTRQYGVAYTGLSLNPNGGEVWVNYGSDPGAYAFAVNGHTLINGTATVNTSVVTPTIKLSTGATSGYIWACNNVDGSGEWIAFTGASYKGKVDGDDGKPEGSGTPLIDGTGTTGWYYACYDAGTYDYGNPSGNSITLAIGDQLYYNGTIWLQVPGAGAYTLPVASDVTLGGIKVGSSLAIASEILNIKDGDLGDATFGSSGTTLTIDADAITYAKIQNVSAQWRVLGRSSSGAGDVEELVMEGTGQVMGDISPVVVDSLRVPAVAFGTPWINSTGASTRGELYPRFVMIQDSTTKHTGWYYSLRDSVINNIASSVTLQDSITKHTGWYYSLRDSVKTNITDIVNLKDSITKHKGWYYSIQDSVITNILNITKLQDSIAKHKGWYYTLRDSVANSMDSIVNHTVRYYAVLDSLFAHRTLIDNHTDSITKHTGWYYSLRDSSRVILDTYLPAIWADTTHWGIAWDSVAVYDTRLDALELANTGTNTGDVTLAVNSGLAFTSGQTGLHMGTPSSITASSTNSVTTDTHTHAITGVPSPFYVGLTSVTSTGGQLNYLNAATGTTGTGKLMFDTSPVVVDSLRVPAVAFGNAWINSTGVVDRGSAYNKIKPMADTLLAHNTRLINIEGDTANFLLRNGSRTLTADWAAGAHKITVADTVLADVLKTTGNGIIGGNLAVGTTTANATITAGGADPKIILGTAVPNTWFTSSYDVGVIQSGIGVWASRQDQAAGNALSVGNNIYLGTDGDYHYMIADEATRYSQANGVHNFRVAGVGSADATISFITALTLSATGQAAFVDSVTISDRAYNDTTWNGSFRTITANSARDQFVKIQDSITKGTGHYYSLRDTVQAITGGTLGNFATKELNNLTSVAINTSLLPGTSDSAALGSTSKMWSDLYLAEGGVINFNNSDFTITHLPLTDRLSFSNGVAISDTLFMGDDAVMDWKDGGLTITTVLSSILCIGSGERVTTITMDGYSGDIHTFGHVNIGAFEAYLCNSDTLPISKIKSFYSDDLRIRLLDETGSASSGKVVFSSDPTLDGVTFTDNHAINIGTDDDVIISYNDGDGLRVESSSADISFGNTINPTRFMKMYNASGSVKFGNPLLLDSVQHGTADYDKFLVNHGDTVKYRTGTELFADIGLNDSLALFARLAGATFTGKVTVNDSIVGTNQRITGTGYFGDDLTISDASTLKIGTDADLQIYNSGTSTIFKAAGDMLFGNSSSASDAMRIFYNSGAAYVSCRFNGDEIFYTGSGGLYMPAGQAIYLNSTPLLKRGTDAGTDPATWDADDLYGVTRKSIKAYVSANASGGSGVTSVTATSPLASSGGITPDISLGTVTYANGGTGLTSIAAGSILAANSANTYTAINSTSGTKYLRNVSGTVGWALESDLIVQTVTNGQTTTAPSQDAVFDQLTTKADKAMFAHQDLTMAAGASSWDCSAGQNATLAITGNVTLTLSKLTAGTSGNLSIINPGGAYTITVAHASAIIKISSSIKSATATFTVTSGGFDVFSWYYDGEYLWWNGTKGYQ